MNKDYMKIIQCIKSSKTDKHYESCHNMVMNFEKKFYSTKNEDCSYAKKLVINLNQKLILEKMKLSSL